MMSVHIPPHDLSVCMVKDMIPGQLFNPQRPPQNHQKHRNMIFFQTDFFQDFRMIAITMAAITIIAPLQGPGPWAPGPGPRALVPGPGPWPLAPGATLGPSHPRVPLGPSHPRPKPP